MKKKFSERATYKARKKSVEEVMSEATTEIRTCMGQALQRLTSEYPDKRFHFNGKYVEMYDLEEDLSTLPF